VVEERNRRIELRKFAKGEKSPKLRRLTDLCLDAVQQSKNSGKRKTNRALNPKRSDFFMVKINCETASLD
jgi:hypothetical protein